ncbi:MAG: DUF4276 family protein [Chloroflexi bacterium]|nr:DUF4276 family protein [Chloroflexota bacterium]
MLKALLGPIQCAVEGALDEAVLNRLIRHVGATPGVCYGKQGKPQLLERLAAFNQAGRFGPWAILVDLDQDEECAPPFLEAHLPALAPRMCCRVVVRAIEAWLMADREHLAAFLDVALNKVPHDPEQLANPKQVLVNIAGHSRRRDIREDMQPRVGSGRSVGPSIRVTSDRIRGDRPGRLAA